MKKVFLVLLAAGMFVACGNKAAEEETTDTVAVVEEVVEAPVVEEAPAVEEAPVAEETKTIKSAATKAAINAIEKGSEAATDATVNEIQTKSRR